ncbi:hypothetical protein KAM467_33920 [Aeromonas caviae]|nr:hypothetical protein KAM467_33920 [Aeromonas caviae]
MHDMSDYHTLSARQITTAIGQLNHTQHRAEDNEPPGITG